MRKLFDTHNHCEFSFDGKRTTAQRSAQSAYEKGLGGIVFTDHYDLWIPDIPGENIPRPQDFDITAQQTELNRVQSMFDDGFKVLKGIELGMNGHSREEIRKVADSHQFDQIIASIHYLQDSDPYYRSYYEGKEYKEAYGLYLETIYNEAVLLENFDIIGHFDYVARYAPYAQNSISYKDFSDILDTLFSYMIHNGKALEINTKQSGGGNTRPTVLDKELLLRYRDMGGEIISLGSDSHIPEGVADKFPDYAAFLKSLGFRWSAHYEKRQLVQLPL